MNCPISAMEVKAVGKQAGGQVSLPHWVRQTEPNHQPPSWAVAHRGSRQNQFPVSFSGGWAWSVCRCCCTSAHCHNTSLGSTCVLACDVFSVQTHSRCPQVQQPPCELEHLAYSGQFQRLSRLYLRACSVIMTFRQLGNQDGSDPAALGATAPVQQGLNKADQKVSSLWSISLNVECFFSFCAQIDVSMFQMHKARQKRVLKDCYCHCHRLWHNGNSNLYNLSL